MWTGKRTVSAFVNMIVHYSSQEFGGSTITQQLIKVLTQENEHKIERKITEILRAIEMERNYYSKDEILEAYLNVLPLSSNVVGGRRCRQLLFWQGCAGPDAGGMCPNCRYHFRTPPGITLTPTLKNIRQRQLHRTAQHVW